MIRILLTIVIFVLVAPLIGGLLSGIDRIISARMQSRVGPPLFQPFYDIIKLWNKEKLSINKFQNLYLYMFLLFMIFNGVLLFLGEDLLLVIFALTLGCTFFILCGYIVNSPFSHVGALRELIMLMSYEPMLILTAVAMYMVTNSFHISDIVTFDKPLILYLPGIFLGFVYILTIKLKKSPFDLSTSHHAHQELVKGLTTEFSGRSLAIIELAHWYENVFVLAIIYLFFAFNPIIGVIATLATYFLEIVIDNTNARFKWQYVLNSSWLITFILGLSNIVALYIVFHS